MKKFHNLIGFAILPLWFAWSESVAQERLKISYSSVDAPNANWYIAEDRRFYQKYGLDVDLVFIPTSTTNVATLVAGSVKVGNISGGSIANAVVGGANLVAAGCFINTLPYELIVHESIRTARKEESKKIFAKYSRQSNEAYLESAYQTIAKLFERVPLATREGMEVQINDALALMRKPGTAVKAEDIIDDRLVVELEKEGFIDRIYK